MEVEVTLLFLLAMKKIAPDSVVVYETETGCSFKDFYNLV